MAVLEGLEKPGNVGAVLRSADGAGVDAVIVADPRTDLFNPNTIRASLGTVFGAGVCTATAAETLAWLRRLGVPIFAARPEATLDYADVDYRGGAAIVLGSEAEGLSAAWTAADVTAMRLPMRGVADSLNVSATAAVLFYEAQRQRAPLKPTAAKRRESARGCYAGVLELGQQLAARLADVAHRLPVVLVGDGGELHRARAAVGLSPGPCPSQSNSSSVSRMSSRSSGFRL